MIAKTKKPRDVQIEPVLRRQLDGDQDRGGQGGGLGHGAAAGDEGDQEGEGYRERLEHGLEPFERVGLAPDAERGAAVQLALDRALVERGKAGLDGGKGEHQGETADEGDREEGERAEPRQRERSAVDAVASVEKTPLAGREQRGERQRGELGEGREGEQSAAFDRRAEGDQRPDEHRRDQSVVGVGLERVGGERVGGPGEAKDDAEAVPRRAGAQGRTARRPWPGRRRSRRHGRRGGCPRRRATAARARTGCMRSS